VNRMTDYMKKKVVSACLGIAAETFPSSIYLAAYTTATSDQGAGTEVTGEGYARQKVTFNAPVINTEQALSTNITDVEFATAQTAWGTVTHIALMDAITGGNMLYHGAVATPKTIEVGDRLRILPGDLKVYQK